MFIVLLTSDDNYYQHIIHRFQSLNDSDRQYKSS